MRPVGYEHATTQAFGSMKTAGVIGNINAPQSTVEYWVGRYGNYQAFGHAGEDIGCPVGTPVRAMADGVVLWADWGTNLPGDDSEWGYRQRWYLYKGFPGIVTVIQHPGWIGIYAHLSNNDAAPRGAVVKSGQVIALSGNTGGVDPHLHREALVDLNYTTGGEKIYGRVDPTRYDGIAAQGSIEQDDFLMALSDEDQKLIKEAAARLLYVFSEPRDKALTTAHLPAIADAVLDDSTDLPGGGSTTPRTKVKYQKQEFNVLGAKIDALAGVVATLASNQGGVTVSQEDILGQLDKSVKETLGRFTPAFIEQEEAK
ncbi:M23 family metallopeptidase [Arthrobacter sp. CC3]|uniref:M23 family metallopeptidase n=1 Tax=Arthrobacter sp. CC3 TaxID=3029185 RepID=UPI00326419B1